MAIYLYFINFNQLSKELKRYVLVAGSFGVVICLSILTNSRWAEIQDWFELYKLGKFLFFVLFLSKFIHLINLDALMKFSLLFLFVFNVFHYFDLFGFNHKVMPYYSSEIQWRTFGLNSLGQPDIKRILGTMGNPNNFAVLMLFYIVYFLQKNTWIDHVCYFLSFFLFLACQSRTGLLALVVLFVFIILLSKLKWKDYLRHVITFSLGALFLFFMSSTQESASKGLYITAVGESALESNSAKGRLEMWSIIWEKVKEKPLLGYAPDKEFFYSNEYYPESEYFLILYRYGFLGLFVFIAILLYSLKVSSPSFALKGDVVMFCCCIVFAVSSLTNTPFSDQNLILILALSIAIFFNNQSIVKKNEA
ncbi:MAG: O-antigen ligase family protein [Flavobacteriales bacterium]